MAEKVLLTVAEVSHATGLSRSKIYELMKDGGLDSVKIGRSRRVATDALRDFVARCATGAA